MLSRPLRNRNIWSPIISSKRFVHKVNLAAHHKRLADSAKFLFGSAGISVRTFSSNRSKSSKRIRKPLSIYSLPESTESAKTSRWRTEDLKVWKFPTSVESPKVSTDSPAWLSIPLNDVTLPQTTQNEGLLPGINCPSGASEEHVLYTLKQLREYSLMKCTPFPTALGRVLRLDTKGKESVVVPLAYNVLAISGFQSGGWVTTGLPGTENHIETKSLIGGETFVLQSIPDFLIWKNFNVWEMEPVGTAFCEVKRKGVFCWPQILGELLAVAADRAANGFLNPDGSVDSYSISIGGPSVRIISAHFPPDYLTRITANVKVESPVIQCWPEHPKSLLIESERKEIFQALTQLREHIARKGGTYPPSVPGNP
eukprot:TRINITY_DN1834_c0_g1_i1.p1 TRINITY_DN1834_c0_g1~~TRINITY_DN1834_c0_g1_i1.p1  ORF type:complete len:369 (+),score=30.66 TRINITY_DN1834_c0_g1_i1:75-1181(+)